MRPVRTSTHHGAAGELAAEGLVERLLHVGVEREAEVAPGDRLDPARLVDDVRRRPSAAAPFASTSTFSQPRVPRR